MVQKLHCIDCGKELHVRKNLRLQNANRRCKECFLKPSHGHATGGVISPTYRCWVQMKQRCTNPKKPDYKYYGGRGIEVCMRWLKFENFLADMGERPEGLTLDRINNDGNYESGNCRWATRMEQMHNTRHFCGIGPRWRDGHFHTPKVIQDREAKRLRRGPMWVRRNNCKYIGPLLRDSHFFSRRAKGTGQSA